MEIFIIDDCSTDGTREKVESWAKLDERIKPIYKPVNSGIAESLNMAIEMSSGEYLARMDGDDISLPERINKQVDYLEVHKDISVLGSAHRVIGTKTVFRPLKDNSQIKIGLLIANQFSHPTIIFRKKAIGKLGRFYLNEFIPQEDYVYWCFLYQQTILGNLEEVLLLYRSYEQSSSKILKNDAIGNIIVFRNIECFKSNIPEELILYLMVLNKKPNTYKLKIFFDNTDVNVIVNEISLMKLLNKKTQFYDKKYFAIFCDRLLILLFKTCGWKRSFMNFQMNKIKIIFLFYSCKIIKEDKDLKRYLNDFIPSKIQIV
jgi:glycosyltransferase involved in cell wall biosynthesis